jgi:hypothetical protein
MATQRSAYAQPQAASCDHQQDDWSLSHEGLGALRAGMVQINVCLKMGHTANYGSLMGKLMIIHWILVYPTFGQIPFNVHASKILNQM